METQATPNLRYELADRLEAQVRKLQSRMRGHFTDTLSICTSCKYAHIMRQASKNARVIQCSMAGRQVPEDITECNSYQSVTELSLTQMAEIAVLITPSSTDGGYL